MLAVRSCRILFAVIFGLFAASVASAQTPASGSEYWFLLERGKKLFREGAYGESLINFEDARRRRADLFENAYATLIPILSTAEYRSLGDDLGAVETQLRSRRLYTAVASLDLLRATNPENGGSGSVAASLLRLKELKNYPEAEFWIGEVFRAEGEYSIAIAQYLKALEHQSLLDIGDEARDIRYALADVYEKIGQYNAMEAMLLEICVGDWLWSDDANAFTRTSMSKLLAAEGVDRFLMLYRHDAYAYYSAHRDLGLYYYKAGRHDRAAGHLTFAFLIESTLVLNELKRRDMDWRFSTLADAWNAAAALPELRDRLAEAEFYRTTYYFGAALYAVGKRPTALFLWRFVAASADAGEWRTRSERQLRKPFVEESVPL